MEFLRNHALAVSLSTLLHVVLALALTVGLDLPARQRARAPVEQVAIQATVVDERLIQQEMERLEALEQAELRAQQERADEARRQREEEERRLEAARVQREEVERQEEARLAEVQSLRESEERAAREAEAARLEAEQQRREEEERIARLREEEQRQQREEEERRRVAAEAARRQAESEAELARAMAAEEEARRAEEARLLDEYIRLIENRIQQNWIPPATAPRSDLSVPSTSRRYPAATWWTFGSVSAMATKRWCDPSRWPCGAHRRCRGRPSLRCLTVTSK